MSFSVEDSALKLIPYNPAAFTLRWPHTPAWSRRSPLRRWCSGGGWRWREPRCRTGLWHLRGQKKTLWRLCTSTNSEDGRVPGEGSHQATQLQVSLFNLTVDFNLLIKGRSSASPFSMAFIILYKHTVPTYSARIIHNTELTGTAPRWSAGATLKQRANKLSILKVFYCWALLFFSNTLLTYIFKTFSCFV